MTNELMSAREVAAAFKIARNTVYELIKRGELPSFRVGKQVRINRADVEAYLAGAKTAVKTPASASASSNQSALLTASYGLAAPGLRDAEEGGRGNEFIICGQDIAIDIIVNYLDIDPDTLRIYRSYLGSYNALYALYHGHVNMAVVHLWDGDLDEYNVSFVRKMLPGIPALIMRIGERRHGFYVKKGNPKGLSGWNDLKRDDIVIANREKGSGTRVLLDESLRLANIRADAVRGYGNEHKSHLAAAAAVMRGSADFAIGSESGCKTAADVDFLPLTNECHDLVIRQSDSERQPYRKILDIVLSDAFKRDLESIGGYDTRQTGSILW